MTSATTTVSQPTTVKSDPAVSAAASAPAAVTSAAAARTSEASSAASETAAETSESTEETSEPPAKRQRSDDEPRQPVVLLERLFDADDEEPTSPKEVEDIIASLDAEEETPRSETPHQQSVASPSAVHAEEEVVQSSSEQPGPSGEGGVGVDVGEGSGEVDCGEESTADASMDCESNASKDVSTGNIEGCATSGEGCAKLDVASADVGVSSENVEAISDACGDLSSIYCEKSEGVKDTSAGAEMCAEAEQSSPDIATTVDTITSSETHMTKSMTEQPASDISVAVSKYSEPDSESACDDDAASECGLVVDEEAATVSLDAMEVEEDVNTAKISSIPLGPDHQADNDVLVHPDATAVAVGTSTSSSPDLSAVVNSPVLHSSGVESHSKRVTSERATGCTAGTQTSQSSVSKLQRGLSPLVSSAAASGPTSTLEVQDTGVGGSSLQCKPSEAKSDARSMSSVSCGTQDIEELSEDRSRELPAKVDCSVQTVSAETTKRSHKKSAKPVLSGTSTEVRRQSSLQNSQTGAKHPECVTDLKDGTKTVTTVGSQSLKSSLAKVTHPELVSRLVQSVDNLGDSRQTASPGSPNVHTANILKIPNAPSIITSPHGLGYKQLSGVVAKATKRSPDSSSMASAKSSADIKHFFKEVPRTSSGVTKYLEKNHKRALTGSPLDLSTRANKTAADSTSMVPKRPGSKLQLRKQKPAKAQGTQTIHSIVRNLSRSEHISLTPIPSGTPKNAKSVLPPKQKQHQPLPPDIHPVQFPYPAGMSPHDFYTSPLHVNTSMASRLGYDNASMASRLSYDMAMRNLLTLSHMAMAQGGMVRPQHMFPMQSHMFPPRPKSHDFHPIPDPSLLRQQSEARMGAASKKASPTAGTTAPQLRTPTGLTSASIQHMEDLTRTVGKRAEKEQHSVTVTPIPPK